MNEISSKKYTYVVTTLYEGHYHFGVAALVNSLSRSGFRGLILIGYKGELPPWTNQLQKISADQFLLSAGIDLRFVKVTSDMHFGYYKPSFIKLAYQEYPDCEGVYYFDPDIVVSAPWPFFSSWIESGTALCLDLSFPFVHYNHPWRAEWRKLAGFNQERKNLPNINYYVNSGFIGIKKKNLSLIEKWIEFTELYRQTGGDISQFEKSGERAFKGDQDLLNASMSVLPEQEISIIGSEGMGFTQPAYLMSHAVGSVKPWKKGFTKYVIKTGKKPNIVEKNYFRFCNFPIVVFPKQSLNRKKLDIKLASAIGRFLGN